MPMIAVTPVLRMMDVPKALEFYADFLGFAVVFEHRFGENFPLYLGLQQGDVTLHLTEHHGDATPGSHVRIAMTGVVEFIAALRAKDYRYAKPGVPEQMPWGSLECTLDDPFGNRLTFFESEEPAP